ncbi:unnamed protein product [Vicia faba]|uniref:Glycosyl hydrolase family 38 C-terminal domain-containing protein n=1 Tax=Vicia faba TaxID=3906 RepID=A0AAV0Z055_VICFA|nr:unnamed protein product [Vicia faba]
MLFFIANCVFLLRLLGAYVFRPNGLFPIKSDQQVSFTGLRSPILDEIGPIPVDDGTRKEVITQFSTTMKTNKTFYTDSNGHDFIKRIRDFRTDWDLEVNQPVVGNYYPLI